MEHARYVEVLELLADPEAARRALAALEAP